MSGDKTTPLNSVRSAIKEKIDPFESMEVENLAQHAMLISQEIRVGEKSQSSFEESRFKTQKNQETICIKEHILDKRPNNLKTEDLESIEENRFPNEFKGDKIINQNDDFIVYQRRGTNFFIS